MKGGIDKSKLQASGYVEAVETTIVGNVTDVTDADIKFDEKQRMFLLVDGIRVNIRVKKDAYDICVLKFNAKVGKAEAGLQIIVGQ